MPPTSAARSVFTTKTHLSRPRNFVILLIVATPLFNFHILPRSTSNVYPFASATMSFSSLVQDLSYRDPNDARRPAARSTSTMGSNVDDRRSHISRAMSYASTTATSVSISGDISSQLHGGYSHPLARSWQAERQLTKASNQSLVPGAMTNSSTVNVDLPSVYFRPTRRRTPYSIPPRSMPSRSQ